VCLDDAIKRYKLYLRKLNDNIQIDAVLYERALNRFVPSMSTVAKPKINLQSTIHIDQSDLNAKAVIIASKPPLNGSSNHFQSNTVQNHQTNGNYSAPSSNVTVLNGSKRNVISNQPTDNTGYTFEMVLKLLSESYYMR
jgi:hypothetical protein